MNVNALASSGLRSTAGAPPATQDTPGADSFAHLLDREQAAPPEASDSTEPTQGSPAPGEGPQAAERNAAQRARTAKGTPRPVERPTARPTAEAEHAADAEPAVAKDGAPAEAATAATATPTDPALLHWLQGLNLPTPPATATGARTAGVATSTDPSDGADTGTLAAQPGSAAATRAAGRDHRLEALGDRAGAPREMQALRGEVVAQAETARAVESAAPRFQDSLAALRAPGAEAAAAASASAAAAPTTPADPALQVAQAALPVPLDDPQFPRAFGVQVSLLARDGVQQADLHLNPAEMGPVSIQIVMDGTQARIDFGADAAPTRALIEQSLPDLAAALREAGLTLAGGGVSQHAGGRDAGGAAGGDAQRPAAGRTGGVETGASATSARPPVRTVRAGGVDLYA